MLIPDRHLLSPGCKRLGQLVITGILLAVILRAVWPGPMNYLSDAKIITSYPNKNYTISLGVETTSNTAYSPLIESKAVGGFTVNLGSSNVTNLDRIPYS